MYMEKKPQFTKAKALRNVKDTTVFCDEFSKGLETMYFSDNGNETDVSETFNFKFVIEDISRPILTPIDS